MLILRRTKDGILIEDTEKKIQMKSCAQLNIINELMESIIHGVEITKETLEEMVVRYQMPVFIVNFLYKMVRDVNEHLNLPEIIVGED